eukprot:534939-Lingulodinium_polyedra.AAC.1
MPNRGMHAALACRVARATGVFVDAKRRSSGPGALGTGLLGKSRRSGATGCSAQAAAGFGRGRRELQGRRWLRPWP